LQGSFAVTLAVTVSSVGWVIVVAAVPEQPFLSCITMVYVPAESADSVDVVLPPVHAYVYGDVPPDMLEETVPVLPPLQFTFWVVVAVTVNAPVCVMVIEAEPVHPFLSVALMVYVPALRPVAARLVPPVGLQA
jgi:hypothetical protein